MNKLIVYLLLLLPLCLQAQEHLLRHEYKYRLSNGFDLLLVEDSSAKQTTMFLAGKLGPFLEDSTTDGAFMVCFELLKAGLNEQLGDKVTVDGYMRMEYFLLELSGFGNEVEPIVEDIQTVMTQAWWDSADVEAAKIKALQHASTDPVTLVGEQLSTQLWADDAPKLSLLAPTAQLMAIDSQTIAHIINELFCPSLMRLAIHTPLDHRSLRSEMIILWNDWEACRVPHSVINFVPTYRPMQFSLQDLIVKPVNKPTYMRSVQGPTIFNGQDQLLFGMMIEELVGISDTVALLLDSLQLENIELDLWGGKYASELLLYANYNGDSTIAAGQQAFLMLIDSLSDTARTWCTLEEMAKAKAVLVDQLQDTILGTHRTLLLCKHWASGQEALTTFLSKELDKLKPADMVLGFKAYFTVANNASALILPDSTMLDQHLIDNYTTTRATVFDHVFHFKKNTGTYSDSAYEVALNELYQFMRNNDMNLQVIGLSSKEELGHVTDADMVKFFKSESMPYMVTSGRKAKRDNIPLELYRVMVVIRYLVERGISPDRLVGTGMRLPKNDPFIDRAGTVYFQMQY